MLVSEIGYHGNSINSLEFNLFLNDRTQSPKKIPKHNLKRYKKTNICY